MDSSHTSVMSGTTAYHSFNDNALYEPASPPRRRQSPSSGHTSQSSSSSTTTSSSSHQKTHRRRTTNSRRSSQDERPPTAPQMKRQDSGYESHASTPRQSISHPNVTRPSPPRRTSTSNVQGHTSSSSISKTRGRPSTRRSMQAYSPHNGQQSPPQSKQPASLFLVQSLPSQHPTTVAVTTSLELSSYVHFPSPPSDTLVESQQHQGEAVGEAWHSHHLQPTTEGGPSGDVYQHPPPPQTTHYWTSDRTRRLEYAAIDAASRGVKGWIRRNLLPDCFVPQDDGHIAFDDDTGSVRRYRLELEDDVSSSPCKKVLACSAEKRTLSSISVVPRRMRTWQLWGSSKESEDRQMIDL